MVLIIQYETWNVPEKCTSKRCTVPGYHTPFPSAGPTLVPSHEIIYMATMAEIDTWLTCVKCSSTNHATRQINITHARQFLHKRVCLVINMNSFDLKSMEWSWLFPVIVFFMQFSDYSQTKYISIITFGHFHGDSVILKFVPSLSHIMTFFFPRLLDTRSWLSQYKMSVHLINIHGYYL